MTTFLKYLGLISALLASISILIGIPAWQFGVRQDPKVIFFFISYFVFFLMLEERFGEEYQSYCQQSKRLFPYIY